MNADQVKQALEAGIVPFAYTTFRNKKRVFGIKEDDRRRHVYVVGKTGTGKTTLIENMVYADILAGHGVCYIDPHGDTAERMLEWIPKDRINDVIYFNPADLEYPISFNVLEKVDPKVRHLVSSGLVGVFKKLWADSWGPRLEYILRNAILALLEYPDSTLLGINRLLVDKEYLKKVVAKISDPVVRSFWVDEFPRWNERVLQEVVSPIQNKVGQFLSTALIRNIVGQVKSSVNLRKAMDDQKIIILNLSKGRIGEDASALFGAMLITKLYLAAMSRVDIEEEERKDFYLYVDEFQNFITDSFKDILSEARKYRLNLIVAHQYIEQLGEVVQPAVFGNVGTLIVFRVGAADAEFLEKEFEPDIIQQDLVNLPKFNVYIKLMIDGVASEPFSAFGLPPVFPDSLGNEQKVIEVSRERYAKPRDIVEDKIYRWSLGKTKEEDEQQRKEDRAAGITVDIPSKKQLFEKDKADSKPGFPAVCAGCEKKIEVPFKPDGVRPTYCQDCLKKARRGEIEIKPQAPAKTEQPKPQKKQEEPGISLKELDGKTVDFKGKPQVKTQNPKYKKQKFADKKQAEKPQQNKVLPKQEQVKKPSYQKVIDQQQTKSVKKVPINKSGLQIQQSRQRIVPPPIRTSNQQLINKNIMDKQQKPSQPRANLLQDNQENKNAVNISQQDKKDKNYDSMKQKQQQKPAPSGPSANLLGNDKPAKAEEKQKKDVGAGEVIEL